VFPRCVTVGHHSPGESNRIGGAESVIAAWDWARGVRVWRGVAPLLSKPANLSAETCSEMSVGL